MFVNGCRSKDFLHPPSSTLHNLPRFSHAARFAQHGNKDDSPMVTGIFGEMGVFGSSFGSSNSDLVFGFPCVRTDAQKCNSAKYAPLLAHIRVQSGEASEKQDYARVSWGKSTFSAEFNGMSHP
jgi:hypothetical protein